MHPPSKYESEISGIGFSCAARATLHAREGKYARVGGKYSLDAVNCNCLSREVAVCGRNRLLFSSALKFRRAQKISRARAKTSFRFSLLLITRRTRGTQSHSCFIINYSFSSNLWLRLRHGHSESIVFPSDTSLEMLLK